MGEEDGKGWGDERLDAGIDAAEGEAVRQFFRALGGLWGRIQRHREARYDTRRAMEHLGFPARATAYRHYPAHSEFGSQEAHPDNEAALASLVGALGREALAQDLFREEERILVDPSERNLVLIGSPSSDALTRAIFGYDADPTGEGLVLRDESLSGQLHFRWELDPAEISEAALVRRRVPGLGDSTRRNWAIVDQRDDTEAHIRPGTDDDGFLSQDYLLLTRIPNVITEVARHSGRSIVSIGGAHGTATRAIEAVLRSPDVVSEIRRRTGDIDSYQALIRVGGIRHDDPEAGTAAHVVSVVDAHPVKLEERSWQAIEDAVRKDLAADGWFQRDLD